MTREEIIRHLRWHQAWHGLSDGQIEAVADVLAEDVDVSVAATAPPESFHYDAIYVDMDRLSQLRRHGRGTPGGQHDYQNWRTCMCGQPGCGSYRPITGGPTSREIRAQEDPWEAVPIPVVSPDRKIINPMI